jgi:protein-L-isoaspartate(D-aspartate) O-methyltransferase
MKANTLPDIERARFNMIEQQIRPWDVSDSNVLEALFSVKRELFVPSNYRAFAFSDLEVPLTISSGETHQTMLAPKLEAKFTQLLQLKEDDCVLEVGTGSGYQAALLAHIARGVTSVDIDPRLAAFAQLNLQHAGISNVKVEIGDASNGWGTTEYDAILVTGAVSSIPDALKYQLCEGGRMVVVVGQAPAMTAYRVTRTTAASFETTPLFETVIKPLNGTRLSKFKF